MLKLIGGEFIVMGIPVLELDDATARIIDAVQPSGFIAQLLGFK